MINDDVSLFNFLCNFLKSYLSSLRFFLSAKKVCIKDRLTPEMFNEVLGEIESKF